ncbi:MAG: YbhB/YbcL family Raf kinase inhibitor-like protein [Verrucomicrobiota bacterium]
MSNSSTMSVSSSIDRLAMAAALALGMIALPSFAADPPAGTFILRSPEVTYGGTLPEDYTGDGTSSTLPLEWSGAPAGTKGYALIMHHNAPDAIKWYWILYNIPAEVQTLPKNVKGVGTLGSNSVNNRGGYAPPHSKGPGAKTYIYTVYALSAPPDITVPALKVNRDVLLAAMKDKILASAELKVVYSRPPGATDSSGEGGGTDASPGQNRPDSPGDRPPRDPNRQEGQRRPPGYLRTDS